MKNLIALMIVSVLLVSSVFAISHFAYKSFNIKVVQKNPTDWSVVKGASGNVLLSHGVKNQKVEFRAKAIVRKLDPFTDYTLIYYGFEDINDVWNHATCITSIVTNKHGNARMPEAKFDYSGFVEDGIGQKFWVVPTRDLDCKNNKFTAWNPTEYLFEWDVI